MREKKIYCPTNEWDCPYFKYGECGIENPINECDHFGYFWGEDDEDKYTANEKRTVFEEKC